LPEKVRLNVAARVADPKVLKARLLALRVRFMAAKKPHGLDYSLTLHGIEGDRFVGFDNVHPVAG
jgi:hypothetical protein